MLNPESKKKIRDGDPEGEKIMGWIKGWFPENFEKIKGSLNPERFFLSLKSGTECMKCMIWRALVRDLGPKQRGWPLFFVNAISGVTLIFFSGRITDCARSWLGPESTLWKISQLGQNRRTTTSKALSQIISYQAWESWCHFWSNRTTLRLKCDRIYMTKI